MHQEAEEHRMEDWEAKLFQMEIVRYQPPDPIMAGNGEHMQKDKVPEKEAVTLGYETDESVVTVISTDDDESECETAPED